MGTNASSCARTHVAAVGEPPLNLLASRGRQKLSLMTEGACANFRLKIASATTLAVSISLTGWGTAFAQTEVAPAASAPAAVAQTPDYTLAYNIGIVTDYRYRGITQSRFDPALQAGVDFAHRSGFYLGAWASGIKWIKDAGASDGSLELDLYGGYKGTIAKDLSYDVGYLRYQYVDNKLGHVAGFANANTDEIYGALTWGIVTAKYSDSLSNLFGTPDSKNSVSVLASHLA